MHLFVGDIHICEVLIEQTSLVGTSESEQIGGEVEFFFVFDVLVAAVSGNDEIFREMFVFCSFYLRLKIMRT